MKPIAWTCLAACCLAALAAVVRHEGATYRRELGRRRQATDAPVAVAPPAIGERKLQPAATPPAIALEPPPEIRDETTRPAPAKKIEVRPESPPIVQAAVEPRPADVRRPPPDESREPDVEPSRGMAAGRPLRDDPVATRRLEIILDHLAASRSRSRESIRFHVLDSADIDAFSEVGGHIYVSRGVFALAQTDAELEFVVAHELAHAELGHPAARREPLTAEKEFAADAWAYQALRRAGRSHRESVVFLRRYARYAEDHKMLRNHPPGNRPGDSRQDVETHYPALPPAGERLKRLEAHRDQPRGRN